MNKTLAGCLSAALALMAGTARADCAADATLRDVQQAYARGQQKESAGDARGALGAFVAAQAYTCDPNPVAIEAARRAAPLARTLGDAARARGEHDAAFDFYERGGHFAEADRELLARLSAAPDDAALYGEALRHVQERTLPAFQQNEAVRLGVTGAYRIDAALLRAVEAMPRTAAERALAAEAAAFDETWYAGYLALQSSRPENAADFAALQAHGERVQAFHASHPEDALGAPIEALERLQGWQSQVRDEALAAELARRRAQRAESRAMLLTQKYAGAPQLLELAIDYLDHVADDSGQREPRIRQVRRQAEGLGDAALAANRHQLAIEYFSIAGAADKAEQARARQQALARQQMQPAIAAMQRDAEALRAQLADPQKMAELQRHAQEAQRAMQAEAQRRKSSPQQGDSADDLAAQLGLED